MNELVAQQINQFMRGVIRCHHRIADGAQQHQPYLTRLHFLVQCHGSQKIGRIRLQVILDYTSDSLKTFIDLNIESGSTIVTDSWPSYPPIIKDQAHEPINQSISGKGDDRLYGVHLIASLVKRLIVSTHQGRFEPKYLQNYLDEYVFRFNRRKSKYIGKKFMRIVQQAVRSAKIRWKDIRWDLDPISDYFALEHSA